MWKWCQKLQSYKLLTLKYDKRTYIFKWTVPFPAFNGFEGKDQGISTQSSAVLSNQQLTLTEWRYDETEKEFACPYQCKLLFHYLLYVVHFFLFFLLKELCERVRRCQAQICNPPVIKGAHLLDPHRPIFHIMPSWLISRMHFKHQKLTDTLPHNKKQTIQSILYL